MYLEELAWVPYDTFIPKKKVGLKDFLKKLRKLGQLRKRNNYGKRL